MIKKQRTMMYSLYYSPQFFYFKMVVCFSVYTEIYNVCVCVHIYMYVRETEAGAL